MSDVLLIIASMPLAIGLFVGLILMAAAVSGDIDTDAPPAAVALLACFLLSSVVCQAFTVLAILSAVS